jgi:hypothetical protein
MPGIAIGTVVIVASAHVVECLLLALGTTADVKNSCLNVSKKQTLPSLRS